jgi:hypothetical protein
VAEADQIVSRLKNMKEDKQQLTVRAQKRTLWLAKVKSDGCQSEAVHGVPCPMRYTALYYNLHHNNAALRCTGETNKLIRNESCQMEEFKKYLARADLVVLCECCHRLAHPDFMLKNGAFLCHQ